MIETWKPIPGYEGIYEVSDLGNVKSLSREVHNRVMNEKILKPCMSKRKYYSVVISKEKNIKRFSIHQLVAMAFLDHKPNGNTLVVDHINGKHDDNRLVNLQILTQSENLKKRNKKLLLVA